MSRGKCKKCGKSFNNSSRHAECPKCQIQKYRHPCPDCGKSVYKDSIRCRLCSQHYRKKINQEKLLGKHIKSSQGYILEFNPTHPRGKSNNGYVFEHIIVMEKKIGRYLINGETVHHINGIKDDNRIENLELWSTNHPSGMKIEDMVSWARDILKLYT